MLPAQIECQSILVFNLKSAPRCRRRRPHLVLEMFLVI